MILKSVSLNTNRVDCFNCDWSKDNFFHVGLSWVWACLCYFKTAETACLLHYSFYVCFKCIEYSTMSVYTWALRGSKKILPCLPSGHYRGKMLKLAEVVLECVPWSLAIETACQNNCSCKRTNKCIDKEHHLRLITGVLASICNT